jgi:hypothetical protein
MALALGLLLGRDVVGRALDRQLQEPRRDDTLNHV